jgi:hypothetical protein
MRKLTLTSLLILSASIIFAQKEIPGYGKIDKADLQLKSSQIQEHELKF